MKPLVLFEIDSLYLSQIVHLYQNGDCISKTNCPKKEVTFVYLEEAADNLDFRDSEKESNSDGLDLRGLTGGVWLAVILKNQRNKEVSNYP